jgi:hypothetical protein
VGKVPSEISSEVTISGHFFQKTFPPTFPVCCIFVFLSFSKTIIDVAAPFLPSSLQAKSDAMRKAGIRSKREVKNLLALHVLYDIPLNLTHKHLDHI